jgi:hypothetical protein
MTSVCHRCRCPSNLRCSSCRMRYCSISCQKKDWRRHIFICRIKSRPNDVDFLKIMIRRWFRANDELRQASTLTSLFSDDNLCKTFGFNNCADVKEVGSLLCFYRHMILRLGTKGVQLGVDGVHDAFGNYMEAFATITTHLGEDNFSTCSCIAWYLHRRSTGFCFHIPNWNSNYLYQVLSLRKAEKVLSLESRDDEVYPLSITEKQILALCSMLFRDFNNIPDSLDSRWFSFGFCFCKTQNLRQELAKLYLQLIETGASLDDITNAYESKTLSKLMRDNGHIWRKMASSSTCQSLTSLASTV